MLGWFRRDPPPSSTPVPLQQQLADTEREVAAAPPASRAALLNRAGDLCLQEGATAAAHGYYGRAIDAYLEARSFGPAAAMCRKLIKSYPDVVRARCTLACLSVGNGQFGDAEQELLDYVAATRRTRTERFAIPRLRLLAELAQDPQVRRTIGRLLVELGDTRRGERVVAAAAPHGAAAPPPDEGSRWQRLVHVALLDPQEMWQRSWLQP
ncbi:MAG: hypothetical protein M3409_05645 [Gemmatimonadota bacterium]|jgi:predicted Zn-dependent protease|nr:hypothetical protein [Gemmatimonadota bacterium]